MPEYTIRKVHFEELDLCADIIRQSFSTVAYEFGLTVQNCPTNGAFIKVEHLVSDWNQGISLYGLYCDEVLIGFMELKRRGAKMVELEKLAVLPQHRHLGCGALLLQFARMEAANMGGRKITIGIIQSNTRLKDWYIKHGFVCTKTATFSHLPFVVGFMEMLL